MSLKEVDEIVFEELDHEEEEEDVDDEVIEIPVYVDGDGEEEFHTPEGASTLYSVESPNQPFYSPMISVGGDNRKNKFNDEFPTCKPLSGEDEELLVEMSRKLEKGKGKEVFHSSVGSRLEAEEHKEVEMQPVLPLTDEEQVSFHFVIS
jgi:hypothetical protein